MANTLPIDELKPGMVIVAITRQQGPVKIRKSGLVTSEAMVQGLKEMGVVELAIDPDQTVELDNTSVTKQSLSDTQKLFASAPSPQQDQAVTDQFNRSLFMPSIQSLPAPWQYYGRRAGVLSLMLAGGFAIGWLLATWPMWWPDSPASPATVVSTPSQPDSNASESNDAPSEPSAETTQTAKTAPSPSPGNTDTTGGETTTQAEPTKSVVPKAEQQASHQADNISPELLRKFEQAVTAVNSDDKPAPEPEAGLSDDEMVMVHELPPWALTELPSMTFSAHMYASNPKDRWVNVNGRKLGEGDAINEDLRIVRIEPQHVVMAFRGQQFSMRALTDW